MKLLVLTDLHQKTNMIPWINDLIDTEKPDAVLCLGDITDLGTTEDAVSILASVHGNKYVLPGNCDTWDVPKAISSVATDMHGKAMDLLGHYIAGLGGGTVSPFNSPFELSENEIDSLLRPISKKGMILMTHAPAFDTLDHIPNGTPVGSHAIRKIIDDFEPILAVSGHIHEDIGIKTIGRTVCVNPGPAMDGRAAVIDVTGAEVKARLIGP